MKLGKLLYSCIALLLFAVAFFFDISSAWLAQSFNFNAFHPYNIPCNYTNINPNTRTVALKHSSTLATYCSTGSYLSVFSSTLSSYQEMIFNAYGYPDVHWNSSIVFYKRDTGFTSFVYHYDVGGVANQVGFDLPDNGYEIYPQLFGYALWQGVTGSITDITQYYGGTSSDGFVFRTFSTTQFDVVDVVNSELYRFSVNVPAMLSSTGYGGSNIVSTIQNSSYIKYSFVLGSSGAGDLLFNNTKQYSYANAEYSDPHNYRINNLTYLSSGLGSAILNPSSPPVPPFNIQSDSQCLILARNVSKVAYHLEKCIDNPSYTGRDQISDAFVSGWSGLVTIPLLGATFDCQKVSDYINILYDSDPLNFSIAIDAIDDIILSNYSYSIVPEQFCSTVNYQKGTGSLPDFTLDFGVLTGSSIGLFGSGSIGSCFDEFSITSLGSVKPVFQCLMVRVQPSILGLTPTGLEPPNPIACQEVATSTSAGDYMLFVLVIFSLYKFFLILLRNDS